APSKAIPSVRNRVYHETFPVGGGLIPSEAVTEKGGGGVGEPVPGEPAEPLAGAAPARAVPFGRGIVCRLPRAPRGAETAAARAGFDAGIPPAERGGGVPGHRALRLSQQSRDGLRGRPADADRGGGGARAGGRLRGRG